MKKRNTIKTILTCAFCLAAALWQSSAFAVSVEAEERAAMKEQLNDKQQALLDSPIGVFDIENQDGQIVRLMIKGESEVPTTMQGARADRFAREKAERGAKAAFSKFLNEQVVVAESETEGVLIKRKDGTETSEEINATQKTIATASSSFLRGLIVLFDHVEGEGANRKAVVVLGWSKKLAGSARQAITEMERKPETSQLEADKPAGAPQQAAPITPNSKTQTRMGNVENF